MISLRITLQRSSLAMADDESRGEKVPTEQPRESGCLGFSAAVAAVVGDVLLEQRKAGLSMSSALRAVTSTLMMIYLHV